MLLKMTDDIFDLFPDVVLGVVIAHGINNSGEDAAVIDQLRAAEAQVVATLSGVQLTEHPRIAPWRAAYKLFGAKPKETPSSIENLVRRVIKGHTLPHINRLVDIYNGLSLRYLLPVGGEDLGAIDGDILLTRAGDDEAAVHLLGETEARPPKPGEVIYKDNNGAICRRWNWKEAERTKLTAATTNAVLVIEGVPPIERDLIDQATHELADLVRSSCGGIVTTTILDQITPQVDLTAAS